MRISDWSSDVCSSDLLAEIDAVQQRVDLVLGEKIVAHCMTKLVKYAASTSGLPVSSVRIFCTSPTTSACSFCLPATVAMSEGCCCENSISSALRMRGSCRLRMSTACARSDAHPSELQSLM